MPDKGGREGLGWVEEFLLQRQKENLLRTLKPVVSLGQGKIRINGRDCFDFSSNDYLGLAGHPELVAASNRMTESCGTSSSASRLMSGDLEIHHELEEETARFKGKEAALIFNSGYQANLGIINSLCGAGDGIFSDRLNHASIVDGILLSGARFFRFRHNDMDHLEFLLKNHRHKFKKALIITETIFSMDGDRPPLSALVELKDKYKALLMVDEAHATGIFGEKGSGVVEEEGLIDSVEIIMGTFGKALGSFGAYVASSRRLIEYLVNTSRSFIYSTALPPSVIGANIAALRLVREAPHRRKDLLDNACYFRESLKDNDIEIRGSSQIVPIIVGESDSAIKASQRLEDRGFWVVPVRVPTVPTGEARLRISITFHHSKEVLSKLLEAIDEVLKVQVLK